MGFTTQVQAGYWLEAIEQCLAWVHQKQEIPTVVLTKLCSAIYPVGMCSTG